MGIQQNQSGFSLLILLIVLMGLGGFVLANYSQNIYKEVEKNRFERNQEVLQKAKNALLMYAYNYPSISLLAIGTASGPGRLPCPDINDDDIGETFLNCINGSPTVGRFPTQENGLSGERFVDSSGYRLWYAVSHTFSRVKGNPNVINSDSLGSISIRDTRGNILYDGSADSGGIAAIIIAPGPPIKRADGLQQKRIIRGDPDPLGERLNPANYLDIAFGEDNASFTVGDRNSANGVADGDGFILSPVYDDVTNSYITNDQMIVITAEEVKAMAEKAVLKAYQEAIASYQQQVWGGAVANYRYPWLNTYAEMAGPLTVYNPADATTVGHNIGRIPITPSFGDYDSVTLETDMDIDYQVDASVNVTSPAYLAGVFSVNDHSATFMTSDSHLNFSKMNFDGSVNNKDDNIGRLEISNGTINSGDVIYSAAKYFWDGCTSGCPDPADGWEACNGSASTPESCARTSGVFDTFDPINGWSAHDKIRIRLVQARWSIDSQFRLGLDHSFSPTLSILSPPDSANHARVQATALTLGGLVTDWTHLTGNAPQDFIDSVDFYYEQDNSVDSSFNVPSLGNADANSQSGTIAGVVFDSSTVNNDALTLTYDYHVQVPTWISENNWDSSVMMAYSLAYAPDVGTSPPPDCIANNGDAFIDVNECLQLNSFIAGTNSIKALLVHGGEGDLVNNAADIFEGENSSVTDLVFDKKANVTPGNSKDTVLILESL